MTEQIKSYTFSQLGASMAASKHPDTKVVKLQDHIKAMDNKEDVINSLWETFITIAKKLDINLEKAKSHEGNPSDVFIEYIEAQAKEIERLTTGIKEVLIELQELEQSGRDSFEAYEKLQELIK